MLRIDQKCLSNPSRYEHSTRRHGYCISYSVAPGSVAGKAPGSEDLTKNTWDAFAASVSGEWDGIAATFDPQ